ncbi:MAG: hypothetical protein O2981_07545 [Proteobacteria bacterium]|nr:hypothetical protein [Pseudomonadota bacterium]
MAYQQPPAMAPEQLPQQRLYLVEGVADPACFPSPEHGTCGIDSVPRRIPRAADFICQAEWSWSPMNSRLENYHISLDSRRNRWVFWVSWFNDIDIRWRWVPYEEVFTLPRHGITRVQAAQLMLIAYWRSQLELEDVEQFHWLGETDFLSVGQVMAVAKVVWESAGNDDED